MAKMYHFGSMSKTVAEWSEATGIKKTTLKTRLARSNGDVKNQTSLNSWGLR